MVRGKTKAAYGSSGHNVPVMKKKQKKEKKAKDPNKPKRPPSAFLIFMEEFRKQFKEENPGSKSVAVVGKAGGDKWKSLTAEEKAPYLAQLEKRKQEYEQQMQAYNKRLDGGHDDESDKSKSEVNDEEGGSGEEEEDE